MIENPVFIVGHSRSGSTLLASVLGRHSNIYSMPETHFCGASYAGNFVKRWIARKSVESLVEFTVRKNIRLKDVEFSETDVASYLNKLRRPREKDVLDAIFASVLSGRKEKRIIEKTPYHIEHIDRLLSWYPDAKIICILRDGRDAIQSLMDAPWTHCNAQKHAAYWSWCVREAKKKSVTNPLNVIAIRYEDFITEPTEIVKKVLDFIGEEFQESLVADISPINTVPEWERKWKSASIGRLDPNNAYKWKNSERREVHEWGAWIADELFVLGYDKGVQKNSKLDLRYRHWLFAPMYTVWRLYRTHVSERKNSFRRLMK
jgi:LPS sulfotransferase NodH